MTNTLKLNDNVFIVIILSTISEKVNGFGFVVPNRTYPYEDKQNFEKHIVVRASLAKKHHDFEGFIL